MTAVLPWWSDDMPCNCKVTCSNPAWHPDLCTCPSVLNSWALKVVTPYPVVLFNVKFPISHDKYIIKKYIFYFSPPKVFVQQKSLDLETLNMCRWVVNFIHSSGAYNSTHWPQSDTVISLCFTLVSKVAWHRVKLLSSFYSFKPPAAGLLSKNVKFWHFLQSASTTCSFGPVYLLLVPTF